MTAKLNKVNASELIERTAKASGYYKYEVEDVLRFYLEIIRNEILAGNEVNIDTVGWLYAKKVKSGSAVMPATGLPMREFYHKLVVTAEASMKKAMKEN